MSFGDFMTHVLPITCRILQTIPKEKWSDFSIGLAGVSQKPFVMDYLGLLGFDPDQLVDLSLETAEISPHGKAFSANCPPAKNYIAHPADFEAVRNLFSDYIGVGSRFKNRKLYLQRTGKRRFLQESELLPDLRDLGFEIVDLEGMKAKDQIKLFAEAETVIGPHGAGFGNIVFGKNLKVLEWQHPGWIIPCFRNMSAVLGHDYHHLISQQGRLRKRPGQKFSSADIDIPAEAILGELRKAKIT